jgi:diadenosine tetraphosphatase ApaH/serine/threonine PP2A family protein phosphatase
MAYYYNTVALLSSIRSDETNEARFTCTDELGREFSYEGTIIKVSYITKMISDLYDRYRNQMKQHCFFGETIPESLELQLDFGKIVDNLQNTHSGYSFLDDPRNPFLDYRSRYGEWLLSDPERAAQFAYMHDEKIIWKPAPCLSLLKEMQTMRENLLLLCIFSAGPSSRATEVARQLLRNVPGSMHNLLVLFHVVCLVDIQDKTSHKHLRDKYVPHCPSESVTTLLVYNLCVFRPFEEYLVLTLLGEEAALRYHQQLWPGLKETISDTRVSDIIGRECGHHLMSATSFVKVPYKILFWRNFVSAILKHQPDLRIRATHQQYYIDTAMMHSSTMGVARYGVETSNLPMSDPRQVVECIKVGLAWQEIIGVDRKRSLQADIDGQLKKIEANDSGMFFTLVM